MFEVQYPSDFLRDGSVEEIDFSDEQNRAAFASEISLVAKDGNIRIPAEIETNIRPASSRMMAKSR